MRYDFHGLSYAYILQELRREDEAVAHGRVLVVHLGYGASSAAVRAAQPVDPTMGLTPLAGPGDRFPSGRP